MFSDDNSGTAVFRYGASDCTSTIPFSGKSSCAVLRAMMLINKTVECAYMDTSSSPCDTLSDAIAYSTGWKLLAFASLVMCFALCIGGFWRARAQSVATSA